MFSTSVGRCLFKLKVSGFHKWIFFSFFFFFFFFFFLKLSALDLHQHSGSIDRVFALKLVGLIDG